MKGKSTYLVTGGCGFIGSHLADALLDEGHKVIVVDDLSTGKRENLSGDAELIVGSVNDEKLIIDVLSRVDGCFHLAALLGMVLYKDNWLGTNQVNLTATIKLFDAARLISQARKKTVPIVYASSCAVYGNNPNLPLSESSVTEPISAYGADKLSCELHARVAFCIYGIPTIGLRFFNVYGPRASVASIDSGVIPIFLDRIQRGLPLEIFGDGEQIRDFIYVDDVVRHLKFFMKNIHYSPNVFNVCFGKPATINYLTDMIARILKKPIEKNYLPVRQGDVLHSLGDPAKAVKAGIGATVSLEDGLQKIFYSK